MPTICERESSGVVAQLVERCVRNAEVVSSNLISSTIRFRLRYSETGRA